MAVVNVLEDAQRFKLDGSDDALFYSEPRYVHHLDSGFRERLTMLYRETIPPCAQVLDLMSSWVSHLPEDISYDQVIGHGLNEEELAANQRLDHHWIQNLNQNQCCRWRIKYRCHLIVAGYNICSNQSRLPRSFTDTRLKGQLIVAFSNRMFFSKASGLDGWDDRDHLSYVATVLMAQGWPKPEIIAEQTGERG